MRGGDDGEEESVRMREKKVLFCVFFPVFFVLLSQKKRGKVRNTKHMKKKKNEWRPDFILCIVLVD